MIRTHLGIHADLVGCPQSVEDGRAVVSLTARDDMTADTRGLVHGGFTFGLADYAAMLAINDPHVVLGAASTRFLAPVRVGQCMVATAEVQEARGRKHTVNVTVCVDDKDVMTGVFTCFILDHHVLDV